MFGGFYFDKKSIFIILGILVLISLVTMGSTYEILATLLTLPGVLIALSFHEFAHAFAADRLGDRTPRSQGRLTLNPMAHIDPVGIVLLMFAHIGWGKPVQINSNNFTTKSKEKGEAIVALAGPLMNFILAIVFTLIYFLIVYFNKNVAIELLYSGKTSGMSLPALITIMVYYASIVNIGLGVFNLIPIPPLDGSKIFLRFLPQNIQRWIDDNMYIISMVFLFLWITNILGNIISPIIGWVQSGIFYLVGSILSIFL